MSAKTNGVQHAVIAKAGGGEHAPEAVGAVLVCGAGITGIQASLDLAESGFKVYLLDSSPAIGGRGCDLSPTGSRETSSVWLVSSHR